MIAVSMFHKSADHNKVRGRLSCSDYWSVHQMAIADDADTSPTNGRDPSLSYNRLRIAVLVTLAVCVLAPGPSTLQRSSPVLNASTPSNRGLRSKSVEGLLSRALTASALLNNHRPQPDPTALDPIRWTV